MKAAELHRLVLERLSELVPSVAVRLRLVSRYVDPAVADASDAGELYLFLPDLHLLSAAGEKHFRYGFRRLSEERWLRRDLLLEALLDRMVAAPPTLRAALRVVQLGDFVDLWREARHGAKSPADGVRDIVGAFPRLRELLIDGAPASTLRRTILVGNHDLDAPKSPILRPLAARSAPLTIGGRARALAIHGDLLDPIERTFDDDLKRWMLGMFGEGVESSTYRADRTREDVSLGCGPVGTAPRVLREATSTVLRSPSSDEIVNVWRTVEYEPSPLGGDNEQANVERAEQMRIRGHRLMPLALRHARAMREGKPSILAQHDLEQPLPELRTLVIGHSHWPRICVHSDARDPQNDVCIVDCGGWIENVHFGKKEDQDVVPSCCVGVIAGNDYRVYQLDPADALYSTRAPSAAAAPAMAAAPKKRRAPASAESPKPRSRKPRPRAPRGR